MRKMSTFFFLWSFIKNCNKSIQSTSINENMLNLWQPFQCLAFSIPLKTWKIKQSWTIYFDSKTNNSFIPKNSISRSNCMRENIKGNSIHTFCLWKYSYSLFNDFTRMIEKISFSFRLFDNQKKLNFMETAVEKWKGNEIQLQ